MAEIEQIPLLDLPADWEAKWKGMPEFDQKNQMPWQSVLVHFRNQQDRDAFAELIGQKLGDSTKFVWHPKAEIRRLVDRAFVTGAAENPRYPVYIISKGRWESRRTARALEAIGVPYRIVVEPQEYHMYAAVIPPHKILTLPFGNLGQGSIPARNWVWEHALSEGAERHWILDDNIKGFYRLNDNLKTPASTGAVFRAAEDFTERFENVGLSGFNYFMFVKRKDRVPPFVLNTRIYSCILVRNDLPHRWRGRYNEDTDLSLRILKDGLCTILFNAFLAEKATTLSMKGGNTDTVYAEEDARRKMAESLRDQHPDCVTVTWKFKRWQHSVNYKMFRVNKLIPRPGLNIPAEADNYGMWLEVKSGADAG